MPIFDILIRFLKKILMMNLHMRQIEKTKNNLIEPSNDPSLLFTEFQIAPILSQP